MEPERKYVPPGLARNRRKNAAERAEREAWLERLKAGGIPIRPPDEPQLLTMTDEELDALERRVGKRARRG